MDALIESSPILPPRAGGGSCWQATDADSSDDNVREDFESCYVAFCGAVAVDFVDQNNVNLPIRVEVLHDAE